MQISSLDENTESTGAERKLRTKGKKLEEATAYVSAILSKNVLFAGVSGSVSYIPEPDDDIDIFLIVRTNRLWKELLRSFMMRRIRHANDICLSLVFDNEYALRYYERDVSGLAVRDSVNVVSIYGGEYYSKILRSSPEIIARYPYMETDHGEGFDDEPHVNSLASYLVNIVFFVMGSSWLHLKGLYVNKLLDKQNRSSDRFRTVTGLHRFYLETEKYRDLDRKFREGSQ